MAQPRAQTPAPPARSAGCTNPTAAWRTCSCPGDTTVSCSLGTPFGVGGRRGSAPISPRVQSSGAGGCPPPPAARCPRRVHVQSDEVQQLRPAQGGEGWGCRVGGRAPTAPPLSQPCPHLPPPNPPRPSTWCASTPSTPGTRTGTTGTSAARRTCACCPGSRSSSACSRSWGGGWDVVPPPPPGLALTPCSLPQQVRPLHQAGGAARGAGAAGVLPVPHRQVLPGAALLVSWDHPPAQPRPPPWHTALLSPPLLAPRPAPGPQATNKPAWHAARSWTQPGHGAGESPLDGEGGGQRDRVGPAQPPFPPPLTFLG